MRERDRRGKIVNIQDRYFILYIIVSSHGFPQVRHNQNGLFTIFELPLMFLVGVARDARVGLRRAFLLTATTLFSIATIYSECDSMSDVFKQN